MIVQGSAYSNLMNVVASCDSAGFVMVSGWPRINMKVHEMIRMVTSYIIIVCFEWYFHLFFGLFSNS